MQTSLAVLSLSARLLPCGRKSGKCIDRIGAAAYPRRVAAEFQISEPVRVERKDTRVMFMRASADTPEAIQQAWAEFETAVGLKGRKFFGAADVGSHEYRVCAQLNEGDDP